MDMLKAILATAQKLFSFKNQPGTPAVFESAYSYYISVAALNASKAIVTYSDGGISDYGTACVLSVNGTNTIYTGPPAVFEMASTHHISVTALDATKAIVTYIDGLNYNYGTACVLSIDGDTITPGTPVVFESATANYTSVTALDATKAIVTYSDNGNSDYGTACVLSIDGTTITPGAPAVFESGSIVYVSVAMLDSTKVIVTYCDGGNSNYGTACVLSIDGNIITPGTPVVFRSATSNDISVTALDATKALVTYRDGGNASYGTACMLSIDGTTITPGTPAVFESATTYYTSVTTLDPTKAVVTYNDGLNSSRGTACMLSIDGTTITPGAPVVFESGGTLYVSATALSAAKVIVTYRDVGSSNYGTACVIT